MKIGRNDPCHCGSGRKYKKCCLDKDSEASPSVMPENIPTIVDAEDDFPLTEENDEELLDFFGPSEMESNFYEPIPGISDEENILVEEWWEDYEKMDEADLIRGHMEDFMDRHPQLVKHMDMDGEAVFELGGMYRREGRLEEYVDFLLYYQRQFPEEYAESAGYYDSDIIAWLVSVGRADEVKNHLGHFISDPIEFADQLFEVKNLLLAKDITEPLLYLVEQVKDEILGSPEIIGGDNIPSPLIYNKLSDYLKTGYTSGDTDNFAQDIARMLPFEVDKEAISAEWAERFESILRPFGPWEYTWKKDNKGELYFKMCDNFMRYLHENTGITWISAQYHVSQLYEYVMTCLQGNKNIKGKKMFDFSKNTIDKVAHQMTMKNIFFPDATKLFSLLNAIHYFAGYLAQCGMEEEIKGAAIEETTASFYQELYPGLAITFSETGCFRDFPFWGKIKSEAI